MLFQKSKQIEAKLKKVEASFENYKKHAQYVMNHLVRNYSNPSRGVDFRANTNSVKAQYINTLSYDVDNTVYFTRYWALLDALYKDEGFIQRVISLYSENLENFNLNNLDDEQVNFILKIYSKTHIAYGIDSINNSIKKIAQTTALYGGCVIVMVNSDNIINPYSFDYSTPLEVKENDKVWLEVFAPHQCFRAQASTQGEDSYINFFDSNVYVNATKHGKTLNNIHPSRIIKIKSQLLQPTMGMTSILRGFGYSVLEGFLLPWLNYKNVLCSTAEIAENLHKVVLQLSPEDSFAITDENLLQKTYDQINELANSKNGSILTMNHGAKLENLDTSANPLNFVQISTDYIAYTLGIPKTILFGEQSGGYAKDDNSQVQIDKFFTKNQYFFKPYIENILEKLICPSIGITDEINITYKTNNKPNAIEQSQIASNIINMITTASASGLITKEQAINIINQNEVFNYKIDINELDIAKEFNIESNENAERNEVI